MRHLVPEATANTTGDRAGVPKMLTGADSDSFAHSVIHRRHPLLIEQARAAHPYGPGQTDALEELAEETTSGVVEPLGPTAFDATAWKRWSTGMIGRRWDEVPFLWAESYFYRRLLDAVDFFTPGPWFWLDPFAHQKDAELADPALAAEFAALDRLANLDKHERGTALLLSALWGNRADLGFAAHVADQNSPVNESLVVDDSAALWAALGQSAGTVCVVADNAGRELLADLMLIDELLFEDQAREVVIHVKPTPYYVSDATTTDVATCLRRLATAGGYAAAAAHRLRTAFASGRARLRTSWFYVAPLDFGNMPNDLTAEFTAAALTIFKGDLNYRRVFGDRDWDPTTDPAVASASMPGTFAVLRTLKSDVVVGVPKLRLARLNHESTKWRISGTHAMIQVVR